MFGTEMAARTFLELLGSDSNIDRRKFHDDEIPNSFMEGDDLYIRPYRPNTNVGGVITIYLVFNPAGRLVSDFAAQFVRVMPSFSIAKVSLGFPYGNGGSINVEYHVGMNELPVAEVTREMNGIREEKYAITAFPQGEVSKYISDPSNIMNILKEMNGYHDIGFEEYIKQS